MKRSGFTLIEILIVVIILGILAAIVIPQFTNASEDAKQSSVASTVQSVRSQLELYKLNHGDAYPDITANWVTLTNTSVYNSVTYGPYMQSAPVNPFSDTPAHATQVAANTTTAGVGWAQVATNGSTKFFGLGKGGTWIGQ